MVVSRQILVSGRSGMPQMVCVDAVVAGSLDPGASLLAYFYSDLEENASCDHLRVSYWFEPYDETRIAGSMLGCYGYPTKEGPDGVFDCENRLHLRRHLAETMQL